MRRPARAGLSRPPIGAVWGWVQTVAGRTATDFLLPGAALVLSPHQDDETIGCGLLMAEKANRGIPVAVAVATDGSAGWFSSTPRPAPHGIAEARHREWHRALDLLAVPRADRFELNFPDGRLSDHENELADRIGDLCRRVRPSQVFVTRTADPHPDHRTLARAACHAVAQTYDAGPDPRPQVFTYRVYPGEGLWPDGRPPRVTVGAAVVQFVRSVFGIAGGRALVFRAPWPATTKVAAINAYDSQRGLLDGELRYVWDKRTELYWALDGQAGAEDLGPHERST
jgi:LmbE family N-acetylglucosaminyl deacetylase